MATKIIYFDYHGVLDLRGYRGLIEHIGLAVDSTEPAAFMTKLEPVAYMYATGQMLPAQFWAKIQSEYGTAAVKAGRDYYLHVDPRREMWLILNGLKGRVDLGLFTDCAIDKKEVIRHAYDLPTFFEHLVFSCDVGRTKRDLMFYGTLAQNGLYHPDECLVIDNDDQNVSLAVSDGIPAWKFTTTDDFIRYLEQRLWP